MISRIRPGLKTKAILKVLKANTVWGKTSMFLRVGMLAYGVLPNWLKGQVRLALQALGLLGWLERKYFSVVLQEAVEDNFAGTDLSWDQFNAQILSFREVFKGVFVQDRVIPWHMTLYQRPQHLAVAMGKLGYLVVYQTHPFGEDKDIKTVRQVAKNVWVTPHENATLIHGAIRSTYSGVPLEQRRSSADQVLIYEYVDHIDAQIVGQNALKTLVKKKDNAFSGHADIVLASARKLHAEVLSTSNGPIVELVPNAVDLEFYEDIRENLSPPEFLQDFKSSYRLTVGYFGAIAPWLWHGVINDLVRRNTDIGFILIGPDYNGGLSKISKAPNLMLTGPVKYEELPHYASQFDVAFIPFAPGEIAKTTSPLKLFEYFASGKPVVVTRDMAECMEFNGVFGADSTEEFEEAIEKAFIASKDLVHGELMLNHARENSWLKRAEKIDQLIQRVKND